MSDQLRMTSGHSPTDGPATAEPAAYQEGDRVLVGKLDQRGEIEGDPWWTGTAWMYRIRMESGYTLHLTAKFLTADQGETTR